LAVRKVLGELPASGPLAALRASLGGRDLDSIFRCLAGRGGKA
jgi:hypothetical protein